MIENAGTAAAIVTAAAALVTAMGAATAKIIRELEKLTNGKMTRIGESLTRIEKLERKNTRLLAALHSEMRALGKAIGGGGEKNLKDRKNRARGNRKRANRNGRREKSAASSILPKTIRRGACEGW